MSDEHTKPILQTYVVAEVKCYLCGATSGSVESERQPMPRSVMFRRVGEREGKPIQDWRRLRCGRCGGPIFLDEADIVTRRVETYNWLDERPRRGRPPKRLLEQRRREREEALQKEADADQQAA